MFKIFLRHGSNAALLGAFGLAALAFLSGRTGFVPIAALVGAAVFFVSEYTTHRFILHARPSKTPFALRLQERLHYDHHVEPTRLELLFLPLWFAAPVIAGYTAIYSAITPSWPLTLSLMFGSLAALVYYEWVHYVAHIPFVPVTSFGRWMKKYHLWHHFKNEHLWFGVTNPSMDFLGRTYLRVEDVDRSATTRILY
ncbi:MAG: sterol desaturase family protein [Candidatus Baltobacteraceae bacterium]